MIDPEVTGFPALTALSGVRHGFIGRVPGLDATGDPAAVAGRLAAVHARLLEGRALPALRQAEQVHGCEVATVDASSVAVTAGADALVTDDPGITLGVRVADCCAIYLVDVRRAVAGLAHSGRKGTAANIAGATVRALQKRFGTDPADLVAQLSPCVRPPHYEVDFAAEIRAQLNAAGVRTVADGGENTGADLTRFYSYRVERGRTGRMLAFLSLG